LQNLLKFPRIETANLCFRNLGDLTFEEVGAAWGFNARGISHGAALGDLDNDGDLDVVVNNLNQAASVYRNDSPAARVAVRLKGKANVQGIGGRVKVLGGPVTQSQSIVCGSRYLSGDDPMRVFAAGSTTNRFTIEVKWRNGQRSVVSNALPNSIYEIAESGPRPDAIAEKLDTKPLFQDVSELINHRHTDEVFDDFARQPLLPKRLSTPGPGVAWFDVDGDNWDDLIIGTGQGGRLAVFTNNTKGGFARLEAGAFAKAEGRDLTGIIGWKEGDQRLILAGASNYEDATTNGAMLRIFDPGKPEPTDGFRARTSAAGPLAMADIDNDGHLDLFLGGRVMPRGYPEPISSILFRSEAGRFRPDAENSRRLARVGLVNGVVFSDLDADGDADLLLACEWGPLKIYRNEQGNFVPWDVPIARADSTERSTLSRLTGWWNGVTTADFDNDGRLDIVASNWGRNTKYRRHLDRPLRVYWGTLSQLGGFDVLEAYYDSTLKKVVPWAARDVVSAIWPFVQEQFVSHRAYGSAGVEEIVGAGATGMRFTEASTLDSMLFLNRGDHFEMRSLPVEAQLAPAFAVCAGDADGDGNEDVFLSQNFFDVEPETSRYDAGRGLWLRGNGRGDFKPMAGGESGVKVYGQQRGAALGDFDKDGRVDLVVTQNGGETKLFRNTGASRGLRVRLSGPPGNPMGVGAVVRLENASVRGPAREVHAGSGYWSQESAIQVLSAMVEGKLSVRWPGGQVTTVDVPLNASEIIVGVGGLVSSARE
jgi:hypothetical protein